MHVALLPICSVVSDRVRHLPESCLSERSLGAERRACCYMLRLSH